MSTLILVNVNNRTGTTCTSPRVCTGMTLCVGVPATILFHERTGYLRYINTTNDEEFRIRK